MSFFRGSGRFEAKPIDLPINSLEDGASQVQTSLAGKTKFEVVSKRTTKDITRAAHHMLLPPFA